MTCSGWLGPGFTQKIKITVLMFHICYRSVIGYFSCVLSFRNIYINTTCCNTGFMGTYIYSRNYWKIVPLSMHRKRLTFSRPRRSFGGNNELLKRTVFGALSNPVTTYLSSQKSTTGTTSHTENEGTTVTTTKTTRIMRSHITPLSRFSVTPSSRGSAALAGNTSDFNR